MCIVVLMNQLLCRLRPQVVLGVLSVVRAAPVKHSMGIFTNIFPVPYASNVPVAYTSGTNVVHSGAPTKQYHLASAAVPAPDYKQDSDGTFAVPSIGSGIFQLSVPSPHKFAAVAPTLSAVPTAITYQSDHTIELPPRHVEFSLHKTVHIPVEGKIHYRLENFITGSHTTIHKPVLSAPTVAAPQYFSEKTRLAAPEITVHNSEITVQKNSPNFVAAPYDAGVGVEHAAPEFRQVDVPTPVEVPQPVPVAKPYSVPAPHQGNLRSSLQPVLNVDVHNVHTDNVITPIKHIAHHQFTKTPAHLKPQSPWNIICRDNRIVWMPAEYLFPSQLGVQSGGAAGTEAKISPHSDLPTALSYSADKYPGAPCDE